MPGLLGSLSKPGPSDADVHLESSHSIFPEPTIQLFSAPNFVLGLKERKTGPGAGSHFRAGSKNFALYGHCFDPQSRSPLSAETISEIWEQEGESLLDRLEGAFHVVIFDSEARRLTIINDRIGILPMYWHSTTNLFSFGPRLRHLARSGSKWSPNPGAVINFLSVGHYLGSSTQTKEASFLTPATILEIDTQTLEVSQRRYWNLVYDPDMDASTKELGSRLGNAILEAVDLFMTPSLEKPGIFLSGGWDSRSILGSMMKLGSPPRMVITNGVSDEFRFSDTWMAKRMANDLELPYRFCRRIPDAGVPKWLDGVHAGEITTANNPENFGQHQLPPEMFGEIDFIMKGDVTWGSGDRAPIKKLSIAKVIPYPLMDNVKAVLNPDLAAESDQLYQAEIDGVLRFCENEDWTDRRDYLWQMGGINRYILGLGISDEEHIQVRRPLLAGRVLREYTKVPRNLRVLKNLFIQSTKTFYPKLFAYGRNHSSNIAYYYAYMADFVRSRTLNHLDAGHDLGGLLDRTACRKVIGEFKPTESPIWIPGFKKQMYYRFHDGFSHHFHRTRFYSERNVKQVKTSDTMLAFHIYLLLEWFYGARE